MPTTVRTMIRVFGTFDPDDLTNELSLVPTAVFRRGERRGGAPLLKYDEDVWLLEISERPSLDVRAELLQVFSILPGHREFFAGVLERRKLSCQVCISVEVVDNCFPAISLDECDIRRLAELGVSLDIDVM